MTANHLPRSTRMAHALAAAGMSLCMTLAALASLDRLAVDQHAATVLAKAAAAQQARATQATAPRG